MARNVINQYNNFYICIDIINQFGHDTSAAALHRCHRYVQEFRQGGRGLRPHPVDPEPDGQENGGRTGRASLQPRCPPCGTNGNRPQSHRPGKGGAVQCGADCPDDPVGKGIAGRTAPGCAHFDGRSCFGARPFQILRRTVSVDIPADGRDADRYCAGQTPEGGGGYGHCCRVGPGPRLPGYSALSRAFPGLCIARQSGLFPGEH